MEAPINDKLDLVRRFYEVIQNPIDIDLIRNKIKTDPFPGTILQELEELYQTAKKFFEVYPEYLDEKINN